MSLQANGTAPESPTGRRSYGRRPFSCPNKRRESPESYERRRGDTLARGRNGGGSRAGRGPLVVLGSGAVGRVSVVLGSGRDGRVPVVAVVATARRSGEPQAQRADLGPGRWRRQQPGRRGGKGAAGCWTATERARRPSPGRSGVLTRRQLFGALFGRVISEKPMFSGLSYPPSYPTGENATVRHIPDTLKCSGASYIPYSGAS